MSEFSSSTAIGRGRRAVALLTAATMVAAGCNTPKKNVEPTARPTASASASVKPKPSPKPIVIPPANLVKQPGQLVECFAGDIALGPEFEIPSSNLELNPDPKTGNLTGTNPPQSAALQKIAAATAKVSYRLDPGHHAAGTAVAVGEYWYTDAHNVVGKELSQITIDDGRTLTVDGGCYVYQVDGHRVPLDASSRDRQNPNAVTDDLAILHTTQPAMATLAVASRAPLRGEQVLVAGFPTPQDRNPLEVITAVQLLNRSNTYQNTCAAGGIKQDQAKSGYSGGPETNDAAELIGIFVSATDETSTNLQITFNTSTDQPTLQTMTYTPVWMAMAAAAALTEQRLN